MVSCVLSWLASFVVSWFGLNGVDLRGVACIVPLFCFCFFSFVLFICFVCVV